MGLMRSLGGAVTGLVVAGGIVLAAAAPVAAQSADRVKLIDRSEVSGEIVATTANDVEIKDQRSEELKKIPIDQIRDVSLAGEPDALRNARGMLSRNDPASALEELKKIEQSEKDSASDRVLAEIQFVEAAAAARKAMLTGGDLAAGDTALRDFAKKNPRSHHFYKVAETLGDVLAKSGKYEDAAKIYSALEKGPPALRVRAATAKANLFFGQQKYAEAMAEFDAAGKVETDPKDVASQGQKREAMLGRARCMARLDKADEAVKMLSDVIKAADPEDRDSLAKAYTALGDAYRATAGKEQDALIAFLTVDLVYNTLPESHAEALFNLSQLWDKAQNPERALQAKKKLVDDYPDSPWAKLLAGGAKAS